MNAQDAVIIRGYVQALPKTSCKDDMTAKVIVVTDDGTRYHILHKGAGIGLLNNINANVEITGTLLSADDPVVDESGLWLGVKSYQLIDGFDDPWYDDVVR
ncbi:MAG: hypothetical protein LBD42_07130 [Desulfovibrio sp.]|jgi:hypothetical protein|nr:hypothetical protein [Desulfovibrio sp.]